MHVMSFDQEQGDVPFSSDRGQAVNRKSSMPSRGAFARLLQPASTSQHYASSPGWPGSGQRRSNREAGIKLRRLAQAMLRPLAGLASGRRGRRLLTVLAAALLLLGVLPLLLWKPGGKHQRESLEAEQHLEAPPSKAFCAKTRPPLVCAHGGDSSDAPPNSADAFRAALQAGVDCVEIDVARTADNHLVVLHVRELQQLLQMAPAQQAAQVQADIQAQRSQHGPAAPVGIPQLQVGDLTYAQVTDLQWRPGGQRVLTVKEAVQITSPYVQCVTLDVKTYQSSSGAPVDEDLVSELLVHLVHETRCSNCMIWAKSDRVVRTIQRLSPGQRTGYVVMNETKAVRKEGMHHPLRIKEAEVVGMHFGMVDKYHLDLLHGAGKQLHAWTINHVDLMRRMLDVAVDAIVTNHPKAAMQAIERRLEQCGRHEVDGDL